MILEKNRKFLDKVVDALVIRDSVSSGIIDKSSKESKKSQEVLSEARERLISGMRVPTSYKMVISYMKEISKDTNMSIRKKKKISMGTKFI